MVRADAARDCARGACRCRRGGRHRRARDRVRRDRLRRQHRLRPARAHAHRRRAPRRTAARARAVARPRAPAPLLDDASCASIIALKVGLARARPLRRAVERDRALRARRQRGHRAVHSGAGLGRRVGRPGAARASRVGADRRRRGARRRAAHARCARRSPQPASQPLVLAPKEGLALLNGTQVSTALALAGLFAAERAMAAAFVAGALSVDACLGSDTPFDARIQAVRGHRGQIDAARVYRDAARRQRHPRVARRLPPRAGPVQPALPAAGDGRVPRPDAPRGAACC